MMNNHTNKDYDITDLEIWIEMLDESDLKGELNDEELKNLEKMKDELKRLKDLDNVKSNWKWKIS